MSPLNCIISTELIPFCDKMSKFQFITFISLKLDIHWKAFQYKFWALLLLYMSLNGIEGFLWRSKANDLILSAPSLSVAMDASCVTHPFCVAVGPKASGHTTCWTLLQLLFHLIVFIINTITFLYIWWALVNCPIYKMCIYWKVCPHYYAKHYPWVIPI